MFALSPTINRLIVLIAFVFPLSRPALTPLIILLFLLWLFEGKWREKRDILANSKTFLLFFALLSMLFLSQYISADVAHEEARFWYTNYANSQDFFFRHYLFYALILPVMITSLDEKHRNYAISAFILAMFVNEVTSYGIIFGFWEKEGSTPAFPVPFLMNHSIYSIYLVLAQFLLFDKLLNEKSRIKKIFYVLFLLTTTINLFLNAGRIGQLIFILLAFFYSLYRFRYALRYFLYALITMIAVVTLAFFSSTNFQNRMLQAKTSLENIAKGEYRQGWGERAAKWMVGYEVIKEHPFLGVGIDSQKEAKSEMIERKFPEFAFAKHFKTYHNQYIQIGVELGIVGIILYLLLFVQLFRESLYKPYALIIIVTFLGASVSESILLRLEPYFLVVFWLGVVMRQREDRIS